MYNDKYLAHYLAHYGILGMRWGVRRPVGPDGRVKRGVYFSKKREDAARRGREKVIKALTPKEKPYKKMSDDDIRKVVQRLELEKKYKDLTATPADKGKKFVSDILVNSGKVAVGAFAVKGMSDVIKAVIGK